jgi:hypothetical protein
VFHLNVTNLFLRNKQTASSWAVDDGSFFKIKIMYSKISRKEGVCITCNGSTLKERAMIDVFHCVSKVNPSSSI